LGTERNLRRVRRPLKPVTLTSRNSLSGELYSLPVTRYSSLYVPNAQVESSSRFTLRYAQANPPSRFTSLSLPHLLSRRLPAGFVVGLLLGKDRGGRPLTIIRRRASRSCECLALFDQPSPRHPRAVPGCRWHTTAGVRRWFPVSGVFALRDRHPLV
jgi:hypothetical protein